MLQTMLTPAALYVLTLLVPGYLVLRCARMPRLWALCCAPVITMALVAVCGELYALCHIGATPLSVYVPLTVLPLVALVLIQTGARLPIAFLQRRAYATEATDAIDSQAWPEMAWWMPLLFVAMGILICNNLFISELPSLDAVIQEFDNQHHLNVIRAFADAHRISSLKVSFFLSDADAAIMPYGKGTFYPAVWYGQCALLVQATGLSVPAAINVSLAATLAVAYPLGMCAFASFVFSPRRSPVAFCALTCVGFAMFPWCLLVFGPLYPNLVGFALMGATAALCMRAFQFGLPLRTRIAAWVLVVVALIGQAFLQPNTLFTLFVILVPFVAQQTYELARQHGEGPLKAAGAAAVFLVVCFAFWTLCYKSPVFSSVIREFWPGHAYAWQEIINILSQTYTLFFYHEVAAQILLGIFVVLGFVRAVYDRQLRWLAASYLVTCFICFIAAWCKVDWFKRLVAGFWYTDAMRLATNAIVVAALLAAFGFDWLYAQVCLVVESYNKRLDRTTHPQLIAVIMACCFIVLNFMPGFNWPGAHAESTDHISEYRMEGHEYDSVSVKTTFGDFRQILRNEYRYARPVDVHEADFLEQVKGIVGSDLVINNPYDGSTLAYGVYGIRTYYRKAYGFGLDSETDASRIIRTSLSQLADDAAVGKAVDSIDAKYVLLMEAQYSGGSFLHIRADLEDNAFAGVTSVTADTPGFTELLASGACRLYRIEDTGHGQQ